MATTTTTTRGGRIERARQQEHDAVRRSLEKVGNGTVHYLVGWIEAVARDASGYETPTVRLARICGAIDAYKEICEAAIERHNAAAAA